MILNKIKSNRKGRGFTIVELLVVIVVIGILAAITIVSYSGITARATTQSNKSNASSILSAAMVYYANKGNYPAMSGTSGTVVTDINTNSDAKVPTSITPVTTAVLTSAANTNIRYILGGAGTGICVGYWDLTTGGTGSFAYLTGGTAPSDTNLSALAAACVNG